MCRVQAAPGLPPQSNSKGSILGRFFAGQWHFLKEGDRAGLEGGLETAGVWGQCGGKPPGSLNSRAQLLEHSQRSRQGSSPRGSLCPARPGQTSWLGSKSHTSHMWQLHLATGRAVPQAGDLQQGGTWHSPPALSSTGPELLAGLGEDGEFILLLVLCAGHPGLQEPPVGPGVCRVWGWG